MGIKQGGRQCRPETNGVFTAQNGNYIHMKLILLIMALSAVCCSACFALEGDIVTYASEHPAGMQYANGKGGVYGNSDMVRAVAELSDIPGPWTVPKMIIIFQEETDAWLRNLRKKDADKDPTMWPGSTVELERCGNLAIVLAASRDPRAFVALGKYLEVPDFPLRFWIVNGISAYKPTGGPYKEPLVAYEGIPTSLDSLPETTRQVKRWWELNKEQVAHEAEALETTPN